MTALDARWFAEHATAAAWTHALLVQPALEDADAAAADDDWDTCLLACLLGVERLLFCEAMLTGRAASPREAELLLALDEEPTPLTSALLEVHALRGAAGGGATPEVAAEARACLARANAHLAERIPIDVLAMRTPEGFYPALRVAAELERLRTAVGLPPFEWSWWANLS